MSPPAPNDALAALQAQVRRYDSELAERDAMFEPLQAPGRVLLSQRFAPSSAEESRRATGAVQRGRGERDAGAIRERAGHRGRGSSAWAPQARPVARVSAARRHRACACGIAAHLCASRSRARAIRPRCSAGSSTSLQRRCRWLRHLRGKSRCPNCEGQRRTAPMPVQPLPNSVASPGLLSVIATAKSAHALALSRQHRQWQRLGVGAVAHDARKMEGGGGRTRGGAYQRAARRTA